jgi:hypothetical protein
LELEPFNYDEDNLDDENLPQMGPYKLNNIGIYNGQWKNGL